MRRFLFGTCAAALLLLLPPNAIAIEREVLAAPPDPSGLMVTTPSKIELDIEPGVRTTVEIEIFNDDTVPIDVSLIPYDLGPATEGAGFVARSEDYEFGAKTWIQFEEPNLRLKPFERVKLEIYLDPPVSAPVGTNLGGIAVRGGAAAGEIGTHDDSGLLQIDALVQLLLTVPGDVVHDLAIEKVEVKDTLVLGSTRFSVIEATFRNGGNVTERVNGTLKLQSIFGNTAQEINLGNVAVIRGASRTKRYVWRDLPRVGAFTPTVTATGNDGKELTASGDRIVVLPWWVPALIGISIIAPVVWIWWRRRNDWMQYMDEEDLDEWSDPERASG